MSFNHLDPIRMVSSIFAITQILIGVSMADDTKKLEFKSYVVKQQVEANTKKTDIHFQFQNTGNDVIQIDRIASSCGCIKTSLKDKKLSYMPGEKGEITATFEVGNFMGKVEKKIVVWLKGEKAEQSHIALTAQITIPELVSVSPKSVSWERGSPSTAKTMRISALEGHSVHIENVVSTNNHYRHEIKTIEKGRVYELTITPLDTDTVGMAILTITTDSDLARFKRLQAFTMIK